MQKLHSTFFFSSSSLSLSQSPRVFLFQNRIAKIYILLFFLLLFFFCFSSTSPPILIDPHQSYVFIVEVAVNLWSPHYCRFSLSLSLPRIRVACASGSPPVPAPFRRLLSSDFPLFRRFSSCLKSIHGFFFLFLFFIMDPLAHDPTIKRVTWNHERANGSREKKIDRD